MTSVQFPDDFEELHPWDLEGTEKVLLDNTCFMLSGDMLVPVARVVDEDQDAHWGGEWEIGWYDNEGAPGFFKRVRSTPPMLDRRWNIEEPPTADDEFDHLGFIDGKWQQTFSGSWYANQDRGVMTLGAGVGGTNQGAILQPISNLQLIGDTWSVTTKIELESRPAEGAAAGIVVAAGNEAQPMAMASIGFSGGDIPTIEFVEWNDFTTPAGQIMAVSPFLAATQTVHLRLDWSGAEFRFYYSTHGQQWIQVGTGTLGFSPSLVGLGSRNSQDGLGDSEYVYGQFHWFRDITVPIFD